MKIRTVNWKEPKLCRHCEQEFSPLEGSQRFCSYRCGNLFTNPNIGRYKIFRRDKFRCIYCGSSSIEDYAKLEVDHLYPVSLGGNDTADNLVTACRNCNSTKTASVLTGEILERIRVEIRLRNEIDGIDDLQTIKLAQLSAENRRNK